MYIFKNLHVDKTLLQTEVNHPAHNLKEDGQFSSSALIPFCTFGEKIIGAEVTGFDLPVCDIFKPKILYDQLCYETDLEELKESDNENLMKQLEKGFALFIDYNEDRKFDFKSSKNDSLFKKSKFNDENSVSVYLDTISNILCNTACFKASNNQILLFLDPVKLFGEGLYNLHSLKEITVTDSFLGLDKKITKCQSFETHHDCNTKVYMRNMMQKCGCLPLSHRLSDKVQTIQTIS